LLSVALTPRQNPITAVNEMIEVILSEGLPTTRKKLHERFYSDYKEKYPFLPSRVIEGSYIVAGRIVKSFRERRKRGLTRKDKPEYKRVVITIPKHGLEV